MLIHRRFFSLMPLGVSWRLWGKGSSWTGWEPCKYFQWWGTGKRFQALGSGRMGQIPATPPVNPRLLSTVGVLSSHPREAPLPRPTETLVSKPQIVPHPQGLRKVLGHSPLGKPGY